jgi:glutamate-1-semialdehyde aminotransferase
MKKCIYCTKDVSEESVVDFCERCGIGVFGHKMFNTIIQNMNEARQRGDLNQG